MDFRQRFIYQPKNNKKVNRKSDEDEKTKSFCTSHNPYKCTLVFNLLERFTPVQICESL